MFTTSNIFSNEEALRNDWVPDELPEREDEIDKLKFAFRPATNGTTPHNIFLYGKSGQGKTAATEYVLEGLREFFHGEGSELGTDLNVIYASCEDAHSSYQVVGEILTAVEPGTTDRPKGHSIGDLNKRLFRALDKKGGLNAIILDEIDSIGSDDSILYQIPRAQSNGRLENAHVSVVGISNDFDFYNNLSRKVKDTLCDVELHFEPYDANQLRTILRQREQIGFTDGVLEDDVIPLCAALAAQDHGSARQAIQYLHRAGELARDDGVETVTEGHVHRAQDEIDKEDLIEDFVSMTTQDKLALAGLLILEIKGDVPARTKEIYTQYTKITEFIDADTYTKRRMYDHLQAMSTHGFIESREVNKGHRQGRHLEFELKIGVNEAIEALEQDSRFSGIPGKLQEIQELSEFPSR
jgi:cell division control protein 6